MVQLVGGDAAARADLAEPDSRRLLELIWLNQIVGVLFRVQGASGDPTDPSDADDLEDSDPTVMGGSPDPADRVGPVDPEGRAGAGG